MTNATKAGALAVLNGALGLIVAFAPNLLTDVQIGAILAFGNTLLGLIVAVTYKDSPKRIPDPPEGT